MENVNDEIVKAIEEKTFDDGGRVKIRCASALGIAEKFGVKPRKIGEILNDRNIRITQCQLGCFR